MKIAVYVAVAVALGLIVMLAPLMAFVTYGYHSVISQSEVGQKFLSERVWNSTDAASYGGNDSNLVQSLSFSEAAQLYGWMDVRTEPFPTSLVPAILLVVTGFVTALGTALFIRNKV
jgi:hypothetical protein